jgi:uncharacterized protein (TIRG00374 family)
MPSEASISGKGSPPGEPNGKPKQHVLARLLPRLVASLLIAAGFVWLLARGGLPLVPDAAELRKVPVWAVAGYAVLQAGAILFRTYRWVYLLRPIAPSLRPVRVLGMGFVGFSAIFLAPLRMGEIVRPYLIAQDGEVTFMQAAGTVFAERTIDGVVLTLFTLTAMSLAHMVSPLPTSLGNLPLPLLAVKAAVYSATLGFCGLFVAMVAFYAARDAAGRATRWLIGLVSKRAGDFAASTLERIADGLRFLPSSSNLISFLTVSLIYWAFMISAQLLLMRGGGLPATLAQATTMIGILGLGSIIPAGPGLFGAYQVAGFSALALFFPLAQVRSVGAAVIFLEYIVNLVLGSLQFALGFWLMARVPAAPRAE